MKAVLLLCVSLSLLGCSRSGNPYAGYTEQSGDLVPFVLTHAIGCGDNLEQPTICQSYRPPGNPKRTQKESRSTQTELTFWNWRDS